MSEPVADRQGPAELGRRPRARRQTGFPLRGVAIFVAVWLGLPCLVIGTALHGLVPGGGWTMAAVWALAAIPLRILARGLTGRAYPSAATRLLVVRPFWYAMMTLPVLALATTSGWLAGWPFGATAAGGRWALAVAAVVLLVAIGGGYVGARRLVVRRLEVGMPRLPAAFDGLRVVQVSDLHVGPHTPRWFLARIAGAVTDARPDLLVYTGDQVDDFAGDVEHFQQALGHLRAPLGTFAVAGNHDVYAGWAAVRRGLEAGGLRVLVNESLAVERAGHRLWVAGTGDPAAIGWPRDGEASAAPDVERTLAEVPSGEPVLVLAHNPALWPALAERGADLTLSGHTHYGQLAVPRWRWSMASVFLELAMGAHRRGSSLLYINPGTNYWGVPFRLGTPPEVTVLTLRAGGEAAVEETSEAVGHPG